MHALTWTAPADVGRPWTGSVDASSSSEAVGVHALTWTATPRHHHPHTTHTSIGRTDHTLPAAITTDLVIGRLGTSQSDRTLQGGVPWIPQASLGAQTDDRAAGLGQAMMGNKNTARATTIRGSTTLALASASIHPSIEIHPPESTAQRHNNPNTTKTTWEHHHLTGSSSHPNPTSSAGEQQRTTWWHPSSWLPRSIIPSPSTSKTTTETRAVPITDHPVSQTRSTARTAQPTTTWMVHRDTYASQSKIPMVTTTVSTEHNHNHPDWTHPIPNTAIRWEQSVTTEGFVATRAQRPPQTDQQMLGRHNNDQAGVTTAVITLSPGGVTTPRIAPPTTHTERVAQDAVSHPVAPEAPLTRTSSVPLPTTTTVVGGPSAPTNSLGSLLVLGGPRRSSASAAPTAGEVQQQQPTVATIDEQSTVPRQPPHRLEGPTSSMGRRSASRSARAFPTEGPTPDARERWVEPTTGTRHGWQSALAAHPEEGADGRGLAPRSHPPVAVGPEPGGEGGRSESAGLLWSLPPPATSVPPAASSSSSSLARWRIGGSSESQNPHREWQIPVAVGQGAGAGRSGSGEGWSHATGPGLTWTGWTPRCAGCWRSDGPRSTAAAVASPRIRRDSVRFPGRQR